jgi:uncharacterized membrane protein
VTSWSFHPIFDSYGAVALLTLGLVLLLLVGPRYRRLSIGRRGCLIGLRCLVIMLLAIAMLRPTLVRTVRQPQSATLLVMCDTSRSMTLPSALASQSRWDIQRQALKAIEPQLKSFSQPWEVKVYGYDQQLKPLSSAESPAVLPEAPQGDQTDLGTSLYTAFQNELGKRVVGVILLGDGAQTAVSPPIEIQQAVRELARNEIPLYTVTIGPVGDAAQTRDVIVETLPEQYTVFVKNELHIEGGLRIRGYLNQPIPVELLVEGPDGQRQTLAPQTIMARADGQLIPVDFPFTPATPGQYKVTLQARSQPAELVTRNNQLSAFVQVREGGLRVLYLYGDLFGEQQKLRAAIQAAPDMQLVDSFINPAARDRWPIVQPELTAANYDVLILESVDATALGADNLQAIASAVEQGKGLLMIGGYQSFGPGGYQTTPLANLLPVEMGRFERQELDQPVSRDLHLWGELEMVPRRDHPILQLAPPATNAAVWQSLPRLQGANKLVAKPTGLVLASTPDDQPLLIAGQYGSGRVLAAAFNNTIRWWRYGRDTEHRRFWRQVILWLVGREELTKNDVWVQLAQRRFTPESPIPLTAGVRATTGEPITDVVLTAQLVASAGTNLPAAQNPPLTLTSDAAEFSGRINPIREPGDYLLEVTATRNGQVVGTGRTSFQVIDRDIELSNPAADYELMNRLAQQTGSVGGKAITPEQLPDLLEEIRNQRNDLAVDLQEKWQLGDTAWDAWLIVLLMVSLWSTEWALRKRWGLA